MKDQPQGTGIPLHLFAELPRRVSPPTTAIHRVGYMQFSQWLAATGISRSTAFRYRKAGLLKTFTLYGRTFISAEASEAFFAPKTLNDELDIRSTPEQNEHTKDDPKLTEIPGEPATKT